MSQFDLNAIKAKLEAAGAEVVTDAEQQGGNNNTNHRGTGAAGSMRGSFAMFADNYVSDATSGYSSSGDPSTSFGFPG